MPDATEHQQRNAADWVGRILCCWGCNPDKCCDACCSCCGTCCDAVVKSGGSWKTGFSADASAGNVSGVQMPMLALRDGAAVMERV